MKQLPLILISAPSGAGKSHIVAEVMKRVPEAVQIVTCTTRQRRGTEVDGVHYHFLTEEQFRQGIAEGKFLEYAEVHGLLYGTPLAGVEAAITSGNIPLLIVDVQGADQIRATYKGELLSVFILPPSLDELRRRLEKRGTDAPETIARRLANATGEMEQAAGYDFAVLNDDFRQAVREVTAIVTGQRKKAA